MCMLLSLTRHHCASLVSTRAQKQSEAKSFPIKTTAIPLCYYFYCWIASVYLSIFLHRNHNSMKLYSFVLMRTNLSPATHHTICWRFCHIWNDQNWITLEISVVFCVPPVRACACVCIKIQTKIWIEAYVVLNYLLWIFAWKNLMMKCTVFFREEKRDMWLTRDNYFYLHSVICVFAGHTFLSLSKALPLETNENRLNIFSIPLVI